MPDNIAADVVAAVVPGGAEVEAGVKLAKAIGPIVMWAAVGLVVLLGLNTVFGFISDPFHLKAHQLANAQAQAVQAKGDAALATGQAGAAVQATQIVAKGVQQHDLTIHVQQENERAILAAPGADQVLDSRLNDAGRRGLCRFAAYADDPECAGLRQPDPGGGQEAHPGDAAPGD